MHVPLTPVMQLKDVSSPKKIAQELISVTLDLATATPENVSSLLLFVTITTLALLTAVTKQPEDANSLLRTVMITMHVPLTVATEILESALTLLRSAMITTSAPETLATPKLESASMKTTLQK